MNENPWEKQLKDFLRKAGGELRRAGEDIKTEAQRLIAEVKDPAKQKRVKEGFKELGTWARKTAEDVAEVVERGVKKAEETLQKASKRVAKARPAGRTKAKRPAKKARGGKRTRKAAAAPKTG